MANYQSANFNLRSQSIAGRKEWVYEDTGPIADVIASGFVSDGAQKGASVGDFVKYYDTSRGIWYGLRVSARSDTGATQLTLDGQVIIGDTS
jgi:hypothetical protein